MFIFGTENKNIFDEIRELSDPPIDSNTTTMFKAQKDSKDTVKIVHVTSVVQSQLYEATIILFVCKENKNKDFIQQYIFYLLRIFYKFTFYKFNKFITNLHPLQKSEIC